MSNIENELSSAGDFDSYGFQAQTATERSSREASQAYAKHFEPKLQRRLRRFEAQRTQLPRQGEWVSLSTANLKKILRKGVPDQYRAEVWGSILGSDVAQRESPKAYGLYLEEGPSEKTCDEIERDLHRTFASNKKFQAEEGRSALRNVLRAFAVHNPRVRYCQGLNFVAAIFLMFMDEERAFWALASAVDRLGVERYYTEGMVLLRADHKVLYHLIRIKLPKIYKLFVDQRIELSCISSEWFITWFSTSLPVATVLRIWDSLLFEGFKVLFRVAIGIFKRSESEILRLKSFDALMENAKDWPKRLHDHNELVNWSFRKLKLKRRDLTAFRETASKMIEAEEAERQARAEQYKKTQAAKAAAEQKAKETSSAEDQTGDAVPASPKPTTGDVAPETPMSSQVSDREIPVEVHGTVPNE